MKIELKSLDLVHFKCFPKLHLDFHEGVNSLFGANAAGKTSVYDALTWLLFDKDSAGHSRPAIKPTGAPAGAMPEVTAILEVDGEPIKLRKVLREKWEKPRGSSIERYAGDTRDYYIDDVPLAENAYKRRIAELIDERQFKLLTDVWAVTKGMHWKDRRTLLAEICGLPEDKQLLATAPQFAELTEKVGRRTVDEYKSVLMKQRKDMNANLNTLPVRVDECSRMVAELESLDFAAAHSESDRLQAERERVQGELVKLTNNGKSAVWNERDYAVLADGIRHGDSYMAIGQALSKSEKAVRGKVYTVYLTESADKVREYMGDGPWGAGAPEPKVKQAVHLSATRTEVRKQLSYLAGLLRKRANDLGYDPYWQRFMCQNWDDFGGCSARCANCDDCTEFRRIRPQYCARCGGTFYERKENRFCGACRTARKKKAQRHWYRVNHS